MFESFNCRAGLFSRERAYTVTPKGLEWSAGSQRHLIDYASIERVQVPPNPQARARRESQELLALQHKI